MQSCELVSVPNAHPLLLGLTPWRQLPIPVIDLARLLGLSSAASTVRRRLVIARDGLSGERFGFFASDEIRSLRGSLPLTIASPSPRLDATFVRATFALEDEAIVAPDLRVLFR